MAEKKSGYREATPKTLDGSQAQSSVPFNAKQVAEGDYKAVIDKVVESDTNNGDPMWTYVIKLKSRPTLSYPWRCTLTPEALFTLAQLYTAIGKEMPTKQFRFDPTKLCGREIGITLVEDEYQADKGRSGSRIDAVFPVSDVQEEPSTASPREGPGDRASSRAAKRTAREPEPVDDDLGELEGDTDGRVSDDELEELDLDSM